jgi:apolipoprotein N-acyltransferase
MTNDSWWGVTQGHQQLMAYARMRAIETRREIARSANSGISAHINARGDVVADTFYGDKTTLFAKVNLYDKITFYTKAGDLLSRISIFVLGFLLFYNWIKKFQNRKKTLK